MTPARKARRGHTLVELLVAMAVAAIVVSMASGTLLWIYRQSHGGLLTTDRLERRQLLRQGLFQLGRQDRTFQLTATRWSLLRRRGELEDTVTVRCGETALLRDGQPLTRGDSLLACRLSPLWPHSDPARDPWLEAPSSVVEAPALDSLAFVRVQLVLLAPSPPGGAPVAPDTLDLRISP